MLRTAWTLRLCSGQARGDARPSTEKKGPLARPLSGLLNLSGTAELLDRSVQVEIDFDVDLHGDGLVIFHGRLEAPVSYRFDSLFIQTQP